MPHPYALVQYSKVPAKHEHRNSQALRLSMISIRALLHRGEYSKQLWLFEGEYSCINASRIVICSPKHELFLLYPAVLNLYRCLMNSEPNRNRLEMMNYAIVFAVVFMYQTEEIELTV